MAVIKSLAGLYIPKRRPKSYQAVDAPYKVGGNKGWVISALPRAYPINSQQRLIKRVAEECGFRKGMAKRDAMTKMKDCVPETYRRLS